MRIFRICIIAVCFPMLLFVTGIFLKIMLDIAPLQTLLGVAIFFLIGILLLAVLLPSNYLGKTKRSIKDSGKEAIDTEDEPPILPQLLSIINGTDKNSYWHLLSRAFACHLSFSAYYVEYCTDSNTIEYHHVLPDCYSFTRNSVASKLFWRKRFCYQQSF